MRRYTNAFEMYLPIYIRYTGIVGPILSPHSCTVSCRYLWPCYRHSSPCASSHSLSLSPRSMMYDLYNNARSLPFMHPNSRPQHILYYTILNTSIYDNTILILSRRYTIHYIMSWYVVSHRPSATRSTPSFVCSGSNAIISYSARAANPLRTYFIWYNNIYILYMYVCVCVCACML